MVVSVIWKVNRSIQKIMYNYKRWCPDIDSVDFKCTCKILTEEFKLTPSKKFGHVCSPMSSSEICREIIGFKSLKSVPSFAFKTALKLIEAEVEKKLNNIMKFDHELMQSDLMYLYASNTWFNRTITKEEDLMSLKNRLDKLSSITPVDELPIQWKQPSPARGSCRYRCAGSSEGQTLLSKCRRTSCPSSTRQLTI